jgi:hypothetical protein
LVPTALHLIILLKNFGKNHLSMKSVILRIWVISRCDDKNYVKCYPQKFSRFDYRPFNAVPLFSLIFSHSHSRNFPSPCLHCSTECFRMFQKSLVRVLRTTFQWLNTSF